MANITKKDNELQKKYSNAVSISIFGWIICIVSFLIFLVNMKFHISMITVISIIGVFIGAVIGNIKFREASALKSGITGEYTTANIISMLPEGYFGIQNKKITYDEKTSEIDMIVVGYTGVFVIETKNMGGTIIGNYNDANWTQHKIGRKGTPYSNTFYSPVKQTGTQVYRLANYLKNNGISVYVNSIIYFSNPETTVDIEGSQTKAIIFSATSNSEYEICDYILNNPHSITTENINKIVALLNS